MDDSGQLDRQLWDAVWKDDIERALQLVEKGASVYARVEYGDETVLMEACNKQNKAMVDLLLKRGAAVNMTDWLKQTALMYAVMYGGDEEIFVLLIEHGADVMIKNCWGRTVVHYAAQYNKTILDRLLLMGACGTHWQLSVDIEDNDGKTPLWFAACHGHVDCVDVLLVHGANPDHKSKRSGSPLDIAKEHGHETIVSMMTEASKFCSHSWCLGKDGVLSKLKENNAKQERQHEELKEKKEQLQRELQQSDHQQGEIARLTADIQQKDEQLKELSSALRSMTRNLQGEEALKALTWSVMKHGADQWYSLGIELGYRHAQVIAFTKDMKRDELKLRALINQKRAELGREKLTDCLLSACKDIPYPIYETVAGKDSVISKLKENICIREEKIYKQERHIFEVEKLKEQLQEELRLSEEQIENPESVAEIQQKDNGCSIFDPEMVFQAVIRCGRHRWFALCLLMGYSASQVDDITSPIKCDADKFRAVFHNQIDTVGERAATKALLEACRCIPRPIFGDVMTILSR